MNREPRINGFPYHGVRPPRAEAPGRWREGAAFPPAADRGHAECARPPVREANEEFELTVVPPSRYRSLLVPLDGSSFGEHALPLALGIARRAGASVRLVHVHSPLMSSYRAEHLYFDGERHAYLMRQRRDYLDGVARRIARVASVPVTTSLLIGGQVARSLREAADAGTDLVVMATHGRGLLGRLWHGGIADALMRRLAAPLLLVRGYPSPVDLTADPAPRHVLIPLDGSKAAEQALDPALALGGLTGAEHTLLRVVRLGADWGESPWQSWDGDRSEPLGYLRRVAARLRGPTRRVHARTLVVDEPIARGILRHARKQDIDLIALATRGRGPLSRLFRGSVAEQVARKATTPVLVVRAAE